VRVLIAAPDQLLTRPGGLRTQVTRTVDELQNLDCQVTLFNPWKEYRLADFDVAHCFSMNTPMYFKTKAIADYGLPLVFSSVMWRVGRTGLIRMSVELLRQLPKQLLNDVVACREMSEWARRILPNTAAEMRWLERAIGVDAGKCAVVPNGVDDLPEAWTGDSDALRWPPGEWPNEDFVLSVAALMSRKNLVLLAEVAVECGYPLVLVGPHAEAAVVAKLRAIQRNHPGKLYLPGALSQSDPRLAAACRQCRVFCLPSNYETPGIAAMEAALKGARIAITEVGGTREYFGDDAQYLQPRSRSSLRSALTQSWALGRPEDPDRIRERLLHEFSWRSVAEKTMQEYRHALSR
jgi:glycosyltransferase involved in cell wall biosynthesis